MAASHFTNKKQKKEARRDSRERGSNIGERRRRKFGPKLKGLTERGEGPLNRVKFSPLSIRLPSSLNFLPPPSLEPSTKQKDGRGRLFEKREWKRNHMKEKGGRGGIRNRYHRNGAQRSNLLLTGAG